MLHRLLIGSALAMTPAPALTQTTSLTCGRAVHVACREAQALLAASDTDFGSFLADSFTVFVFVLWLWLLIRIATDLFRRKDISGLGLGLWAVVLVLLPYIGVFAYILTQSGGVTERSRTREQQARDELRQIVGFSTADELVKLDRLRPQNVISEREYLTLRERLVM